MNIQSKVKAMPSARATRPAAQAPTGLGHSASIAIAGYPLYLREREYSRKIEKLLSRAVMLLDSETNRRERAGDDVSHLRAFIKEARSA